MPPSVGLPTPAQLIPLVRGGPAVVPPAATSEPTHAKLAARTTNSTKRA
jgi:hypothetical protein